MDPALPSLNSLSHRYLNNPASKLHPFLHQLHFLTNRSNSHSPKEFPGYLADNLDKNQLPSHNAHTRKRSDMMFKTGGITISSPINDDFKPSKNVQARLAGLYQRKDLQTPRVNGNLMGNLRKMKKGKALKDRIIIFKKLAQEIEEKQNPKIDYVLESKPKEKKRRKSKSSVPEQPPLKEKLPSSNFNGVLEGFLFPAKKSIPVPEKPKEKSDFVTYLSFPTPKNPPRSSKGIINFSIQDTSESSRRNSLFWPSEQKSPKFKLPSKASMFKVVPEPESKNTNSVTEVERQDQLDYISEIGNTPGNLHRMVFSLGPKVNTEGAKTEFSPRASPRRIVKKLAIQEIVIESDIPVSAQDLKYEDTYSTVFQSNKQAFEFEKNTLSRSSTRASPVGVFDGKTKAPLTTFGKTEKMEKFKRKFNLLIGGNYKKDELKKNKKSKNNFSATGWYVKPMILLNRDKSVSNQEDSELFGLVTGIRDPIDRKINFRRQLE